MPAFRFDLCRNLVRLGSFAGTSTFLLVNCLPAFAQQAPLIKALPVNEKNALYGLAPLAQSSYIPTPYQPAQLNSFWASLLRQADGLMNGTTNFPYLIPLSSAIPSVLSMQTQAIYDAPYTRPNLFQLADGFGSKLGAAYQARATWSNATQPYIDRKQGWKEISSAVTQLIWFSGTLLRDNNTTVRAILGTGESGEINYASNLSALGVAPGVMAAAYGLPVPGQDKEDVTAFTPTANAVVFPTDSYSGTVENPPNCDGQGTVNGKQSCSPILVNDISFKTGGFNVRPFEVAAFYKDGIDLSVPAFYALSYNTDDLVNPLCLPGGAPSSGGCRNYNSNFAYFFDSSGDNSPNIGFDEQIGSSSYASGHAIYGWYGGLVMGLMVPEAFQKMQTRGAENALGRVIGGWHWPTDIIASRTVTYFGVAQMMAGEEGYYGNLPTPSRPIPDGIGDTPGAPYTQALVAPPLTPETCTTDGQPIAQNGNFVCVPKGDPANQRSGFVQLLQQAKADMASTLQQQCGSSLEACAAKDTSRFADKEVNRRFYEATLTLDLPKVYSDAQLAGYSLDFNNFNPSSLYLDWRAAGEGVAVDQLRDQERRYAKNAGNLLLTRFPYLTLEQRNDVLTTTVVSDEQGKGTFLDNGSAFGAYSRINLFKAADGYGRFDRDVAITMDATLGGFNAADAWANNISGPGGLAKSGTGFLRLAGKNTFTGAVVLEGGGLDVSGSIAQSSGLIANAGIVSGTGALPSTVINSAARIAPGNSIGTLTAASLNLNGGAIEVEIQGPQSDRIDVIGNVPSFTGSASVNAYGGGSPFPGFVYTVVSAPSSVDFATSSSLALDQSRLSSALLRTGTTLVQNSLGNPKAFDLQWRSNHASGAVTAAMQALGNSGANAFSSAGAFDRAFNALAGVAGGNANNTGSLIGATGFTSGQASGAGLSSGFVEALNSLLLLPSNNQLLAAVNSLAPQSYAAFQSVGLDTLKQQRETLLAQSGQCLSNGWIVNGKSAKTPLCAFALAQNSTSSVRGTTDLSSYDVGIFSSGFGLEYYPSKQWSVGLGYGYGTSYANNFSQAPATVTANVNSVNLFANVFASDRWRARALLGYSNFNLNGSRSIAYIGNGSSLSGSPNGSGFTAAVETDYAIPLTNPSSPTQAVVKPLLGFAWGSYQQSSFAESGGPLSVSVNSNTANSFVTTAGFELTTSPIALNKSKTVSLRPSLVLAYQVDALANNGSTKSLNYAFSQAPAVCGSCSAEGQNLGTSALNVAGGLDLRVSESASLYVNVSYQAYTNASQFGYGGGVRVRF
jgi:autotransporter-associated beta strand protein